MIFQNPERAWFQGCAEKPHATLPFFQKTSLNKGPKDMNA